MTVSRPAVPTDTRPAVTALVVTALLLASLPPLALWARDRPPAVAALVALLVAATVVAVRSGSAPALRAVLVADVIQALVLLSGVAIWPAPLAVAVLALWLAALCSYRLRPALPWLRTGRWTADLPWLVLATVVISGSALTIWALVTDPAPGPFLESLRDRPILVAVLGVAAFSLVNSACEEALYRGVVLDDLTTVLGLWPAVVVQAALFGVLHASGFPSGAFGMLLAGIYGLLLGLIRLRSRGLLAPYVTHVFADITIGVLAVSVL